MQRSHEMCTRTEKGGEIDTVGALWCGVFSQQLHQQIRLERSKKKTETATAINAETASAGAAAAACAGGALCLCCGTSSLTVKTVCTLGTAGRLGRWPCR